MPLTLLTRDYHLESILILSVNSVPYKYETFFLKSCSFLSHNSLYPNPNSTHSRNMEEIKVVQLVGSFYNHTHGCSAAAWEPGSQSQAFVPALFVGAKSEPRVPFSSCGYSLYRFAQAAAATQAFGIFFWRSAFTSSLSEILTIFVVCTILYNFLTWHL